MKRNLTEFVDVLRFQDGLDVVVDGRGGGQGGLLLLEGIEGIEGIYKG